MAAYAKADGKKIRFNIINTHHPMETRTISIPEAELIGAIRQFVESELNMNEDITTHAIEEGLAVAFNRPMVVNPFAGYGA